MSVATDGASASEDIQVHSGIEGAKGVQPFGAFERMLAMRYIRAKREHGGLALISIVSVIGVTLAVFALITIMSIMNGFRLELLSKIVGFEPHVNISVSNLGRDGAEALAKEIRRVPGVINVAPAVTDQALASANGRKEGVVVKGIKPDDLRQIDLIGEGMVQGDLGAFGEGGERSDTVVIGEGLAESMGLTVGSELRSKLTLISPQGNTVLFGEMPTSKTYRVVGIFRVGNEVYDRSHVFMPIDQARLFFRTGENYRTVGVRLQDPDASPQFIDKLRELGIIYPGIRAWDWKTLNAHFVSALVVERNVMRLIMMIVVMITALNIITGVLMLVKNKARDIAILRTIGATRGGVVRIFLMTGSLLGGVGVLVGLVLGVAFVLNIGAVQHAVEFACNCEVFPKEVYMLDAVPAQLQWSEVAIVTGWAFLMTVVTTLIPSMWASRLDPVEALRNQ